VVIVNSNSGKYLPRALEALERQTFAPAVTYLVDNGSTDGSTDRAEARFPWIEVVRLGRNEGFAAANNVAVRRTDCELVALLNPDAFPEPDWLEKLVEAAGAAPGCASFTSRLMLEGRDGVLDGEGDSYGVNGFAWRRHHGLRVEAGSRSSERAVPEEVFSACAAAALYRRAAFLEAGGFDESFFVYLEDVDLGFRLRLRGAGCLYVPESVAHHVGSGVTGRASDFSVYHAQRNMVWTFAKDMPAPLLWLYLPQHLLLNLEAVAWYSLRGQARTILRAKRDALGGLRAIWPKRREVQSLRTTSALAVRRRMVKGLRALGAALGRASSA
jgi:GT2 family glycosyltransferase